ncbi:Hsp20/alpha crystallin family protein [Azospirillum sp. ST 5-10]|uniref:Hsp20/alpha crystallin family protein n=1 Tax=unclassified Azospirillum TaxID=2630922 RepID=UPI003F4A7FDA
MPFRQDRRLWMWAEAVELFDRAERLQRQFFRPATPGTGRAAWVPPVDLYETDDEVVVVVALPGVAPHRLEVAVADGVLLVAGERPLPCGGACAIHRLEIPHGRFERRVELPSGAFEVTRRDLADGCLVLALRKLG